jgi:tryptophan 7-halogenase
MISQTEPRELPRAIVVIGDGQVGISAAIALRRALPSTTVTVIPVSPDPAAFADRIGTALPFTNRLHDRLGIDEMELVRKAGASHRLVTRYRGWTGPQHNDINDYGRGSQTLGNAFTGQFKGVRDGEQDFGQHLLTPAAALAATGRFSLPDGDPYSPLASVDYAMRWNVDAYRSLLIEQAQAMGVQYVPQTPLDVQRNEQVDVQAILLGQDGRSLAADLFIDCSGPTRWLIGRMEGAVLDSWVEYLPCDRILLAAPGEPVLALEDRMNLTPHGWLAEIGGRDGVQRVMAFPSALGNADAEAALIQAGATAAIVANIQPGALAKPFVRNVVALGDAAASFEPIGGANLDLAHRQLSLLLELLPARTVEPRERDEYNRRAGLMAEAMRTWLASHYLASGQLGTPFARHIGQLTQTPELILLADQYRRRARLPFLEEAPMPPGEWSALLRAVGFIAAPSTHALAKPPERVRATLEQMEKAANAALAAASPYGEWLESVLA